MRIHRNPLLVAKSLTKNTIKKLSVASLATILVASGVLLAQNLTTPDQAMAATPPDSCFAFNAATKTITNYYDNQANNPANPACPRDVDIPSTIGGVAVTAIGTAANTWDPSNATSFAYKSLTSVTIPTSVTSIGNYAFSGNSLSTLSIPNSISVINIGTFRYNQLSSVSIPSSVTSINDSAFTGNKLSSVIIPSSVNTVKASAFAGNELTSLTIPSSVTSIGNYAFSNNRLTSVVFDGVVSVFGSELFSGVSNSIESITYGGTDYTITGFTDPSCFTMSASAVTGYEYLDMNLIKSQGVGCLSLDINIPATVGGVAVTSIGNYAFSSNHLTSVTIPDSVTTIGDSAFSSNQLTSVTIPDAVTSIGNSVFSSNDLTSVTIPDSVTTIGDSAFRSNHLTSVTIPDSVISIGDSAFSDNQLTSVTIPDSVKTIGSYAFSRNYSLASAKLPSGLATIDEGVFYSSKLNSIVIPDTVTSIGYAAFMFNSLTFVTIPDSVQTIDETAFAAQNPWGGIIDDGYPDIPGIWTYDLNQVQAAYDGMWYARLITADPSNPNGLETTILNEDYWMGYDDNEDGIDNSIGGYIVNASDITVNYRSSNGDAIKPSQTYTGNHGGEYLKDYIVSNGPIIDSVADEPLVNASYYRIGDTVTITPPSIPGYLTPAAKTFTLSGATNQGTFTYQKILTKVDFSRPSGSVSNPTANSVPSSLAPAMANSTLTVDTAEACATIDSAKLLPASNFTAPDSTYTTLGGLDFTLSCTTPGEDANVSLSLASEVSDPTTVKVYKKTADGIVTDITNQTTITNQAGKTTISYNLTDGGELDDDGTVNGTITDPIYLTVPLEGNEALLANTGASLWLYGGAAVALILAAIGLVVANRRIVSRR